MYIHEGTLERDVNYLSAIRKWCCEIYARLYENTVHCRWYSSNYVKVAAPLFSVYIMPLSCHIQQRKALNKQTAAQAPVKIYRRMYQRIECLYYCKPVNNFLSISNSTSPSIMQLLLEQEHYIEKALGCFQEWKVTGLLASFRMISPAHSCAVIAFFTS